MCKKIMYLLSYFSKCGVQTGSGAHLASYTNGNKRILPRGIKWQGREAEHSPPSSAKVKMELYLHSSYVFMA
jgi:hypothetical protein